MLVASRTSRKGPELNLVHQFLDADFPEPSGCLTRWIFLEPSLVSGFPDIVIVEFDIGTAKRWPESRKNLRPLDLRIAHFISNYPDASIQTIFSGFGSRTSSALKRLESAGIVRESESKFSTLPVDTIFAVRRIVAIEAKMKNIKRGFDQALNNTWFASESYLLIPNRTSNSSVIQKAKRFGIGIINSDGWLNSPQITARVEEVPKSYGSWLFNEWAWQSLIHESVKP